LPQADGGQALAVGIVRLVSGFRWSENRQAGQNQAGHSDDAETKLLWLVLRNITLHWTGRMSAWPTATHHFALLYEDRFTRTI
jgi:hypothetical protein